MIVADTSALLAAMFGEPAGPACIEALHAASRIAISAGTLVELGIVTTGRARHAVWTEFQNELAFEVHEVTAAFATAAARHYARWGKGIHPASLNMGDIYAYTLAKQLDAPLLYIGGDFSQTDIASVLTPAT